MLAQVVLVPPPLVLVRVRVRSTLIVSISCATIRSSSSCDRWYNSSRRCWSPSCNKSAPATLS